LPGWGCRTNHGKLLKGSIANANNKACDFLSAREKAYRILPAVFAVSMYSSGVESSPKILGLAGK
jgi:hypothetical protein